MANLLFVSIPFPGHLNPAIAVARECREHQLPDAAAADTATAATSGRGTVRFAGCSCDRSKVEAAGLPFVDLGEPSGELAARIDELKGLLCTRSNGGAQGAKVFTLYETFMFPRLVEAIRSGDAAGTNVIVGDSTTTAAHDAAECLGLPLVLLHQMPLGIALMGAGRNKYNLYNHVPLECMGPFVQQERLSLAQRAANPLLKRLAARWLGAFVSADRAVARAKLGLPAFPGSSNLFMGPAPSVQHQLHVVSGSMELEVERPLPPNWVMTGQHSVDFSSAKFPAHIIEPDEADSVTSDQDHSKSRGGIDRFLSKTMGAGVPVVYVATGTIAKPTQGQVDAFVGAMRSVTGARFVWSLAKACHHMLPDDIMGDGGKDRGRVMVLPWAPQQGLLSHEAVKLFVTHGGLNSTYEGVTAGVPMVVTPFFADQTVNAQHVVNKGLGAMVDPWSMTPDALALAIEEVMADGETRRRAADMGRRLRAQPPGAKRAAEAIQAFAAGVEACST